MNWLDAKCNNCGLQREVVVFVEPTKPRSALRCPRCESLNVVEINPEAYRHIEIDQMEFGHVYLVQDNKELPLGARQLTDEEIKQKFPQGWPFKYKPQIIVIAKENDKRK